MSKTFKLVVLVASLSAAGLSWGAAKTAANDTLTDGGTGGSSDTVTNATYLEDTVTLKLSKNVVGSYFLGAGSTAGAAAGSPKGRGHIYAKGTSATRGVIDYTGTTAASITAAATQTHASNAAS